MHKNWLYLKSAVSGLAFVLVHSGSVRAEVRYVKTDGSSTSDCRDSWANACTLPRALRDVSVAGDEIWVQRGRYTPHATNRDETFLINKDLKIYGGFVGDEVLLVQRPLDPDPFTADPATDSILSGDLGNNDQVTSQGDCAALQGIWDADGQRCHDADEFIVRQDSNNSYHVVTFQHTPRTTLLDGFTVTGGNYESFTAMNGGAGVLFLDDGGGSPTGGTIARCSIIRNRTEIEGGGVMGTGRIEGPPPHVEGGDIWIVDSVIAENHSTFPGGGAYLHAATHVLIFNTQIINNRSDSFGGGLALIKIPGELNAPGAQVVNSLIARNISGDPGDQIEAAKGGGIYVAGLLGPPGLMLSNSTVAYNLVRGKNTDYDPSDGAGLFVAELATAALNNCVVWGNIGVPNSSGRQIRESSMASSPAVRIWFSNVERWNTDNRDVYGSVSFEAIGNLGDQAAHDPKFVDKPLSVSDRSCDLSLKATSPCIDAADNTRVADDAADLDRDGITIDEHTPLDLRRQARFVNGATTETGLPDPEDPPPAEYRSPFIVDMGAYEFQADIACTVDADCRDDDPWLEHCVNGLCEECTTYLDCQDGDNFHETCVAGQCVDCMEDRDCWDTDPCLERCYNGRCVDDFGIIAETSVPRRNRFLSFSVTHTRQVALRVVMLDLHHPVPPNLPQHPPPQFGCWEAGAACGTVIPAAPPRRGLYWHGRGERMCSLGRKAEDIP